MAHVVDPQLLYSTLSDLAFIDQEQLDTLYKAAQSGGADFEKQLVAHDLLSEQNLGKIIADLLNLPFVSLKNSSIPTVFASLLPEEYTARHSVLFFGEAAGTLKLATSKPHRQDILTILKHATKSDIQVYYATDTDIQSCAAVFKKDLQTLYQEVVHNSTGKHPSERAIISLTDILIEQAYYMRASDIHMDAEADNSLVRFRIDGALHDVLHIPKHTQEQVIARIKYLANLRTDEHLSAQDGKIHLSTEYEDTLDLRVSVLPTIHGEKCVLRLLSTNQNRYGLSDLGMSDHDLAITKKHIKKMLGTILVTGPTGSGKTTTLYSVLKVLNSEERSISSIEDPVEYDIPGINQVQVNTQSNLNFSEGLRSILRQDPDILYVGEIRDTETAGIAINAALTGHLVLSTLHTNDSATTLPRLVEMGVEPYIIGSTVTLIIGQRLVRRICNNCRYSQILSADDLQKEFGALATKLLNKKDEVRVYLGKGCDVCHDSGYSGRIGVFELLEVDDNIRELLSSNATASEIRTQAIATGMQTMFVDCWKKVLAGETTIEELLTIVA